jgi:hypothetical protein
VGLCVIITAGGKVNQINTYIRPNKLEIRKLHPKRGVPDLKGPNKLPQQRKKPLEGHLRSSTTKKREKEGRKVCSRK